MARRGEGTRAGGCRWGSRAGRGAPRPPTWGVPPARSREGSAEAIPLPDHSFDIVFSSTVMEEVDADRMMAELVRIAKPGGSVAVIVRAVDRGNWTNAPLPAEIRRLVEESRAAAGVAKR